MVSGENMFKYEPHWVKNQRPMTIGTAQVGLLYLVSIITLALTLIKTINFFKIFSKFDLAINPSRSALDLLNNIGRAHCHMPNVIVLLVQEKIFEGFFNICEPLGHFRHVTRPFVQIFIPLT